MGLKVVLDHQKPQRISRDLAVLTGKITFDSSYADGGESLNALSTRFADLLDVIAVSRQAEADTEYLPQFVRASNKLKIYTPTSAASNHTHAAVSHNHAWTGDAMGTHNHALTTGYMTVQESYSDIKGSANTDSENADAGAIPTNGNLVMAEAAVAAGAWTFALGANPDIGRNVMILIHNDSGGPLNLYEGVMTFTVTGTFDGSAQVDTITFTSTAGNKAVATANNRYKYGVKPFDTITTVTVDNICADGLKIGVGIGSKVGIYCTLFSDMESDFVKLSKNGAHLAVTGLYSDTYSTLNWGTLTDGDDISAMFHTYPVATAITAVSAGTPTGANTAEAAHVHGAGGAITAGSAAEVVGGTNLSTLIVRFVAIGTLKAKSGAR